MKRLAAAWPFLAFALAKLGLHLWTSSGYGYFRDELYYLACAEHLSAGYVDHPPLSVLVLALVRATLGDSLLAIRLVPALLGAATVVVTGLLVRELGGGRWASGLAMTAALISPVHLALGHFYSMNAFDLLVWALVALLVVRIVKAGEARDWWWLGLVLGLGLLVKISVLWLGFGLLVGLVATPERRWLWTRWPWLAGTVAFALFSPYLAWQIAHGWPTLEFIENATGSKMAPVSPLEFLLGQVEMVHPFTAPLWLGGLAFLFVAREGRRFQVLAWIYLTVFVLLAFSGTSRSNYLAPAYAWLFAAGAVAAERLANRPRLGWARYAAPAVLVAGGVISTPLVLPILPVEQYLQYARALGETPSTDEQKKLGQLGQFFADMHGWDAIVADVARVHGSLAAEEREAARIFAPDYGVAGAIDLLGRNQGLPPAISGHNNYFLWGPRGWDGRVLIVVGGEQEQLAGLFAEVVRAGTIECGLCMPYENHRPIWVARGLRSPVDAVWPTVKHFD